MITYVICALVLIVAVPTSVWLKREGDRRWAAHQRNLALDLAAAVVAQAAADLAQLRPAFRAATAALAKMNDELRKSMS